MLLLKAFAHDAQSESHALAEGRIPVRCREVSGTQSEPANHTTWITGDKPPCFDFRYESDGPMRYSLFPPGRGTFGSGSLGHPGNGQHATANHPDMGSQCRRCPMDRCIVPPGAGGHASRLLIAQPELDPLQPASLPMLETLRAGFWRRGGTVRAFSNC